MNKPLDVFALLRRGGEMTASEMEQLASELTEGKLSEFGNSLSGRSLDQPVKVIALSGNPPNHVTGYFTQQKFIWGKTPEEMESVLGVFGGFRQGACVLQFVSPLRAGDYENKAYTYLPDGKEYVPDLNERVYLPGKGAPQWRLKAPLPAQCIATLRPGQRFDRQSIRS
jgi:hypothetical protein